MKLHSIIQQGVHRQSIGSLSAEEQKKISSKSTVYQQQISRKSKENQQQINSESAAKGSKTGMTSRHFSFKEFIHGNNTMHNHKCNTAKYNSNTQTTCCINNRINFIFISCAHPVVLYNFSPDAHVYRKEQ